MISQDRSLPWKKNKLLLWVYAVMRALKLSARLRHRDRSTPTYDTFTEDAIAVENGHRPTDDSIPADTKVQPLVTRGRSDSGMDEKRMQNGVGRAAFVFRVGLGMRQGQRLSVLAREQRMSTHRWGQLR